MPFFDWDADLPDDQRDALIEQMAQKAVGLGMASPAILFLELNKPLTFFASQALLIGSGALAPLFGAKNVQQVVKLFESRANVERLIRRIEELSVTQERSPSLSRKGP